MQLVPRCIYQEEKDHFYYSQVQINELPPSSGMSEVQRVRLSLNSCIINVLSL